FVRPQPRGPLSKLKRPDQTKRREYSTVIETENTIVTDEKVTMDYFVVAKLIHETQKKTSSTTEDIKLPRLMHEERGWGFDIHHDDCGDQDMIDCENGNVMLDGKDDKENMDPNISARVYEMDWLGTSVSGSNKRKHSDEWIDNFGQETM